jgi:hypothetical protein
MKWDYNDSWMDGLMIGLLVLAKLAVIGFIAWSLLALTGCGKSPKNPKKPAPPPAPTVAGKGLASSSAAVTRIKVLANVVTNWSLAWSYPTPVTNMAFDVQSTADFRTWSGYMSVTNQLTAPLWATNAQEFFRVRARDPVTGLTSEWNQ